MKESLFNILTPRIAGSVILDLYAGTGNLGIEAMSRGARSAVFVDSSRSSVEIIRENLRHTGFSESSEVIPADVFRAVGLLAKQKRSFDIIFMDPPYGMDLVPKTLEALAGAGILKEDGLIVAERDRRDPVPASVVHFVLYDERKYGDTILSFYKPISQLSGAPTD